MSYYNAPGDNEHESGGHTDFYDQSSYNSFSTSENMPNVPNSNDYVQNNPPVQPAPVSIQYQPSPLVDIQPPMSQHINANTSVPKISFQGQTLKIELEVIIKLRNDDQYDHSSSRNVNRMHHPYRTYRQNFRNRNRDAHSYSSTTSIPRLSRRRSTIYVNGNNTSQSRFQRDESFLDS